MRKHNDPSASVPSLRHLPYSSSLISLARSEGDAPLYAPSLVQDPSVRDLPSQSDIIIAYVNPKLMLYPKLKKILQCHGPNWSG